MKSKKAFTLIELVVVMAIIAVLSLVIVAAITAARRQSIETQNRGNAKTAETAMEAWAAQNNGRYNAAAAGTIQAALQAGGPLAAFAPGWATGTCNVNGGGTIAVPNTSTFNITIMSWDCTNALPGAPQITH